MSFYYHLDPFQKKDGRIAKNLKRLKEALRVIPNRNVDQSLIIATWNIREFDNESYGYRDKEPLYYIAEIISRFDIIAIQEVRKDTRGIDKVIELLGHWWKLILTDVTEGSHGNEERMAFIYDSRKVEFGGLAGEIVIPPMEDNKGRTLHPAKQLYRTPFIAGFKAGWFKFMICTAHIQYGEASASSKERLWEIEALAQFLAKRANDDHAWAENLIVLGDFNIFEPTDVTFKALLNSGFFIPDALQKLPSNVNQNKHYDQIAFYTPAISSQLKNLKAGIFNFFEHVYRDNDLEEYLEEMGDQYYITSKGTPRSESSKANFYKTYWRSYQMSDHLPMWAELKIDLGQEYLDYIIKNQKEL